MEPKKQVIDKKYRLIKKLGEGSFGEVYKAIDINTKEKVALKFETTNNHAQLNNEIQAYESLCNIEGIPKLHFSGFHNNRPYLVLDLFESSLDSKFKEYNHKFSIRCVVLIGIQMLKILEHIHERNYIHRDIKPANIMIGRKSKSNMLYLIDFGLSKKYRDPIIKQHTLYREKRQLIGNFEYSSLNAHLGIEQSRRDDIESAFYLMLKFYKGKLPWDSLMQEAASSNKLGFIRKITVEQICDSCPGQFLEMLKYIRGIRFEERPNYEYVKQLLGDLANENECDLEFDWIKPKEIKVTKNCTLRPMPKNREFRRASALIVLESLLIDQSNAKSNPDEDSNSSSSSSGGSTPIIPDRKSHSQCDQESDTMFELRRKATIKDTNYPEFHHK